MNLVHFFQWGWNHQLERHFSESCNELGWVSLLVDSAGMAPCFRNSANQLISRNMPLLIVFPIEWVAGFLNHPKFSDHLWMTYLATNTTTTTTTFTFHSTVTWFGAWQSLASKLSNCPRIGMPRRVQRRWRLGRLFRRVNRKVAFPPNCDGAKAPWWNQTLEVILISGKLLSICCVQIHRYGTIYIYNIQYIQKQWKSPKICLWCRCPNS